MLASILVYLRNLDRQRQQLVAALEADLNDPAIWTPYFTKLLMVGSDQRKQELCAKFGIDVPDTERQKQYTAGVTTYPRGRTLPLVDQCLAKSKRRLAAAKAVTASLPAHLGAEWLKRLDRLQARHEELVRDVYQVHGNATLEGVRRHVDADLESDHIEGAERARRDWIVLARMLTAKQRQADAEGSQQDQNPRPDKLVPVATLVPALLSASDLAERLGLTKNAVEVFLRRYRADYPDCATENEGRRRNEPHYLYRVADVLPNLKAHFGLS
jgi:hypothetical protein